LRLECRNKASEPCMVARSMHQNSSPRICSVAQKARLTPLACLGGILEKPTLCATSTPALPTVVLPRVLFHRARPVPWVVYYSLILVHSLLEIFYLPNRRKSAVDSRPNPIVPQSWRWGRYTTKRQPLSRVETLAHFPISASSTLQPEAGRCVLF